MSDPILSVHNLVGGYGKMTILNGTTFAVPQATITTIIGPNGAGKSTVFKAIFGLLKLREGKISFAGRDVTNLSQRALLNAGICYVPQGRNIFPELSVRHNIELGGVSAGKGIDLPARIEAALDLFPALRRKSAQQASTLSGGEQKQLEIARSLLLEPKLVLIDEPSIGLSPLMVQQTFDILKELARPRRHHPDDRAERALGAGDFRHRHRARARPDPHGRRREAHSERSAHRPALSRRRHGGQRSMNKRSIATVSLSGSLDEKLRAIASAGFERGRDFRERSVVVRRKSARGGAAVQGPQSRDLRVPAVPRFRGHAGAAAGAQFCPRRAQVRPDAGARHRSAADLLQRLARLARRHRPRRGRFSRARRARRQAWLARRLRGAGLGPPCQRLSRRLGDRAPRRSSRDRRHPRQLSRARARLSGSRDGLDPRRQDLSGAACRCAKARARHPVVEPALPLLPRPGRSAGR